MHSRSVFASANFRKTSIKLCGLTVSGPDGKSAFNATVAHVIRGPNRCTGLPVGSAWEPHRLSGLSFVSSNTLILK